MIQIPCLNEREQLESTLRDLPRVIEGVDEIEVLIIDDGSTDGTSEKAVELGVHHVVRFPETRGLAAAFMAGIDAALRIGADVIVNTDADNQYRGQDIARLAEPIISGRADVVVGDRGTDGLPHFSSLKRLMQRWGSRVVRAASATTVADATSGFRAIGRRAAYRMFVHNDFTYTLETIIHGGRSGLVFANVPVVTNPTSRPSRLFSSMAHYLRRNGPVIARAYGMYRPVQTYLGLALAFLLVGAALVGRFFFYFIEDPSRSGHAQSLVVGVTCVVLSFLLGIVAMLSDLLAANRRLLEEALERLRRLETGGLSRSARDRSLVEGVRSTGAAPWTKGGS